MYQLLLLCKMHFNIYNLTPFHLFISALQMTSTFYLFKDMTQEKNRHTEESGQ